MLLAAIGATTGGINAKGPELLSGIDTIGGRVG